MPLGGAVYRSANLQTDNDVSRAAAAEMLSVSERSVNRAPRAARARRPRKRGQNRQKRAGRKGRLRRTAVERFYGGHRSYPMARPVAPKRRPPSAAATRRSCRFQALVCLLFLPPLKPSK